MYHVQVHALEGARAVEGLTRTCDDVTAQRKRSMVDGRTCSRTSEGRGTSVTAEGGGKRGSHGARSRGSMNSVGCVPRCGALNNRAADDIVRVRRARRTDGRKTDAGGSKVEPVGNAHWFAARG